MQPQKTACASLQIRNRVQRYYKKSEYANKKQIKLVKKRQTYWVLMLAVLFSGAVQAHVNHYIGGYIQAGEWSMLPSGSEYKASLGAAGGLGFVYEMQVGKKYGLTHFLFDAGIGANAGTTAYGQSSNALERVGGNSSPLFNQRDLQGRPFDYYYELSDRKDRYNNLALQIPLMIGMKHKRFYFLGGVKVYANVWTQAQYSTKVSTFGRYEDTDDLRSMPDYQFFDGITKKGSVNTSLNLDIDATFEIGARLGEVFYSVGYDVPKSKMEYRLAAFVDYGLFDLHSKGRKPALQTPSLYDTNPTLQDGRINPNYVYQSKSMIRTLSMNDVMATEGFADKVQNLMVGIKFTILFQLPEEGKCVICRDAYTRSVDRGGSRRGMQYEE